MKTQIVNITTKAHFGDYQNNVDLIFFILRTETGRSQRIMLENFLITIFYF
jgi:hypothetical protein